MPPFPLMVNRFCLENAALVFAQHDALWAKSLRQYLKRLAGLGIAAHENIEGGIAAFGPRMDADVAFGQNRHATNATMRREHMQMDVQQRCPCGLHGIDQRLMNTILVVEAVGLPKIDNQVATRKSHPVTRGEVILAVLVHVGNRNLDSPRRSASTITLCFFDRCHTKSESSHPGTYPSKC